MGEQAWDRLRPGRAWHRMMRTPAGHWMSLCGTMWRQVGEPHGTEEPPANEARCGRCEREHAREQPEEVQPDA